MYERIDLPVDSLIVGLRIQKDISDSENLELVDLIQQRARRHGPVRLLLVYEADPGRRKLRVSLADKVFHSSKLHKSRQHRAFIPLPPDPGKYRQG